MKRYTRLKLKMFLLAVLGTAAAGAVGALLLRTVVDGVLQDPFARFFTWVARDLFGASQERAVELYVAVVRSHKTVWLIGGMAVLMLAAFLLVIGRFTRWLDQVGGAMRQVVSESGEQIHLPKELSPLEDDLRSIQRQLRSKEEAARESEQRKQELVAFLAHDLKTPLTSVVGYLTLLRDKPGMDAGQRAKYTGIALEKAERLEELLGEFFDITRMDFKSAPEDLTPIHLTVLLEQLADEFYPLFAEKDLTCTADLEQHLTVRGEADKLARVFDNVLRNAVSYSTPGAQVGIKAVRSGQEVVVTISNEGLEIPEGELAHIFQKFYRLDAARSTRTGGAGLGLAIAKEIVELHGGQIRAESTGKLTSFVITLPYWEEDA